MCMLTACYPSRRLQAWEKALGTLLLSEVLNENASRGNRDGFGIATSERLVKWEESATSVLFKPDCNNAIREMITSPLIAHVRATSTGATAKEGAHPFKVGHILLAHNGTFTNYQKILAQFKDVIKDPDPVDSNVITHLLAQKVGDAELTPQHILDMLEETSGTYALLILDTLNSHLWVVTGSNPLYTQKQGPFWLVNTSEYSLQSVGKHIVGVADLFYKKEWEISEPSRLKGNTIYLLTPHGCEKKANIPVKASHYKPCVYYKPGASGQYNLKAIPGTEARARALAVFQMLNLDYIGEDEVSLACFVLFQSEWYEVDSDALNVLLGVFQTLVASEGATIKEDLWKELQTLTNQNAYAILSSLTEIQFPYILNTVDELYTFKRMVEEADNVNSLISS